jgi:hypothetical protein
MEWQMILARLWNLIFGINWTVGLGDRPTCDAADDWECGPQGAGYLPVESEQAALAEAAERERAAAKVRERKLEESDE